MTTYPYYKNYRTAVAVCLAFLAAVLVFLLIYGKRESFLLINSFYGPRMDFFFRYVTYLGDGLIYIPIVVYCFFWNRKFLIPALAAIIICTLLAQGLKRFVFEDVMRPISLELENIIIRKVEGEPMRRMHSFPSGHTSTAFTMSLLLSTIMVKRYWAFILPLIAVLVGYSRVYLAQHFVTDVTAGMVIGIISSYLALKIYHHYVERKNRKEAAEKAEIERVKHLDV